MQDHSEGVMIALLPIVTDWCQIKFPHMTLVYCGKVPDLRPTVFNELCKDAASLAAITRPVTFRVTGTDVFGGGEDEKVDVLLLELTPELMAMRRFVERWNASKHPDFKPHATIGPQGTAGYGYELPKFVAFNRICVQWGQDMIPFNLKRM